VRVLLDESLPRQLAPELPSHEVRTVAQQGWKGLKNGALLARAAAAGFQALVTVDRNLEHQQNLSLVKVGIIVIRARSNRIQDLLPLVPDLLNALEQARPGQLLRVG
jgi:predicted nuclease of predicted toxin-antitoxin system